MAYTETNTLSITEAELEEESRLVLESGQIPSHESDFKSISAVNIVYQLYEWHKKIVKIYTIYLCHDGRIRSKETKRICFPSSSNLSVLDRCLEVEVELNRPNTVM